MREMVFLRKNKIDERYIIALMEVQSFFLKKNLNTSLRALNDFITSVLLGFVVSK